MNAVTDLATWLLAQIDDDERVAREATPGRWTIHTIDGTSDVYADGQGVAADREGGCMSQDDAAHIARWDPARVLAECDAKRRIVEWAQPFMQYGALGGGLATESTRVLRLLAAPYADRPGYLEEWKP